MRLRSLQLCSEPAQSISDTPLLQIMAQAPGAPSTESPGVSVTRILDAACQGPGAPRVVAAMVSTGLLATLLEPALEGQQDGTEVDEQVGVHALQPAHSMMVLW